MNTIQFIGTNPADLIAELKDSLISELTKKLAEQLQSKNPTEYLTRTEVCKLLKIDLSTLHRWRKDGILKAYGIQNRVYFKREDIENLINQNQIDGY